MLWGRSNCHIYVYERQAEQGGCIVLMQTMYSKRLPGSRLWRPLYILFGAIAQYCWFKYTGKWQHAVWTDRVRGSRTQYMEYYPLERKYRRGHVPWLFKGQIREMSKSYWKQYGSRNGNCS